MAVSTPLLWEAALGSSFLFCLVALLVLFLLVCFVELFLSLDFFVFTVFLALAAWQTMHLASTSLLGMGTPVVGSVTGKRLCYGLLRRT